MLIRDSKREKLQHKILKSQKKISIWISIFVFSSSLFSIPSASAEVGDLDTSFDTDGKVTTAIGPSSDVATSIALQSDGKIVVVGYASIPGNGNDFAMVRYNTDGSLDQCNGITCGLFERL
jgi:hypothetical protein